jgi:hypothetical protein
MKAITTNKPSITTTGNTRPMKEIFLSYCYQKTPHYSERQTMKIIPDEKAIRQLNKDFKGEGCVFCENQATAAGTIAVDPAIFQGKEALVFPVCDSCLLDMENKDLSKLECVALRSMWKNGLPIAQN